MPRRVRNRIKFELERFLLRGPFHRLLVIALLVAVLSFIGGVLVRDTGEGFADAGDALWWAFLRLTDPGYLGDDQGTWRRTVSTVLTVLGYVVFLGSLVAIMTQWLNQKLMELQRGLTPIAQSNHILVLGWTTRTATIVRELLVAEGRVRRFLEGHGTRRLRVVVLVEETTLELVQDLRDRMGEYWDPKEIILRSGSPMRVEHLRRVDYRHAAAIIVPSSDGTADSRVSRDARVIKVLLSAGCGGGIDAPGAAEAHDWPLVVAELTDADKMPVARRAYGGPIEIIAGDLVIAQLVAQNIRHPGLSNVYGELLSHDTGNEIYVREASGWADQPWASTADAFPSAIPIGIVRQQGASFQPLLNPPATLRLRPGDRLVLLARSFDDTEPAISPSRTVASASEAAPGMPGMLGLVLAMPSGDAPAADAPPALPLPTQRRVLVLGWSHKFPALLRELDSFGGERFSLDVLSRVPISDRMAELGRRGVEPGRCMVHHHEGDYTRLSILAALDPQGYDQIVFLAVDWQDDEAESDARTVLGYLVLQDALQGATRRPSVLVELLDPENVRLFPRGDAELIVSPLVLGHMLTQVALRRELASVFDDIFGPGDTELRFRPITQLCTPGTPYTFNDIAHLALARDEVALGLRIAAWRGAPNGGVRLNPGAYSQWTLAAADEVVVLSRG